MPVIADRYRGTPAYDLVRNRIVEVAQAGNLLEYKELGILMGLNTVGINWGMEVGWCCGEINEDEQNASRPLLAAVVVRKDTRIPGGGFFDCARMLHLPVPHDSDAERAFWQDEVDKVHDYWRQNQRS